MNGNRVLEMEEHAARAETKVTALRDVTVCARVAGQSRWMNLDSGQSALVEELLGVHPNQMPECTAIHVQGATFVPTHVDALPAEPFGLLRVERAA